MYGRYNESFSIFINENFPYFFRTNKFNKFRVSRPRFLRKLDSWGFNRKLMLNSLTNTQLNFFMKHKNVKFNKMYRFQNYSFSLEFIYSKLISIFFCKYVYYYLFTILKNYKIVCNYWFKLYFKILGYFSINLYHNNFLYNNINNFIDSFYWLKLLIKIFNFSFIKNNNLYKLGFFTLFDFSEFNIWNLSRYILNRKKKKIAAKYTNKFYCSLNLGDLDQLQARFLLQLNLDPLHKSLNLKLFKTKRLF